jgi:DNA-binding MurR/RpiR family transcriptional regulator
MGQFDLIRKLRGLDRLTPSEAKIAAFFQDSHKHLAFETVSSISAKTHVSKATVVRFISKLGFDKFSDFQKGLQADVMRYLESPMQSYAQYRRKGIDGSRDYLGQTIRQTLFNLEEAHAAIPFDLLMKAARLLAFNPGCVYVAGQITSYGQAHFFWVGAMYLRPGVRLLDNAQLTLPCQLSDVSSDDVLLVVTRRRHTKQTARVITHFLKQGAKVVLLTDDIHFPPAASIDVRLFAPTKSSFVFVSACATMVVLDALLWAMADLLNNRVYPRLKNIEQLQKDFDTHMASMETPPRQGSGTLRPRSKGPSR